MGRGRHGGTHCEQLPSDRVFRRREVRVRKMKDQKAEICSNKKRKVEGDHKARKKKKVGVKVHAKASRETRIMPDISWAA